MNELQKRSWAEIKLSNITHNYYSIREVIPNKCKFLGIVKADAYGHGAVRASRTLQACGADYLAVSCLDEALELRNAGIYLPILILGHTPPEYTEKLIDYSLTQTVANLAKAKEYSSECEKIGKPLTIHIKLDTGMSRLGFLYKESVQNIYNACTLPYINYEGIYTHFSVSDETDAISKEYTLAQFDKFNDVILSLENRGIHFKIRHCANSGAVINYPEMCLDMVRPGLLLYGYGDNGSLGLKPCMRLVTTISTIKHYESGTDISYGRKYTTQCEKRIGVVSIGYADGLPRLSSGKCSYVVSGKSAPQCGTICMDMCMVDLTDIPDAKIGGEVEIFGENNPISQIATASSTIPYEILCSVSKRIPRIYYE